MPKKNTNQSPETEASGQWRTGIYEGPGIGTRAVQFQVEDGLAVLEGDIVLGTLDELSATSGDPTQPRPDGDVLVLGVGISGDKYRWPNGVVPYEVAADLPDKKRVTDAIAHWHEKTGIRFVVRTAANANQYPNYVRIIKGTGCRSEVGLRSKGQQSVWLGSSCTTGNTIHELGHTVGLWHEQSREDRDAFVEIKWDNIEQDKVGNFLQHISDGDDHGPYDYGSVMHYPRKAFSKNDLDTIVPKQAGVSIGQRDGLSYGDRLAVAKMYERFFTKGYSGVFRQISGGYALWANASWQSFVGKWQQWSSQGLRLVDLNVHRVGNEDRYSGVFLPGSGGHALWANATWASFVDKWQELSSQGLRLIDLNVHRVNGANRYSGVFLPGSGGHGLWANASWASFLAKWQEWSSQGLRLVDVNVQRVNGADQYAGVFLPGSGGHGLWANASWSSFVDKWKELSSQGLRLTDLNVHRANGSDRYTGAFLAGTGGHALWANVTWQSFVAKWEELSEQGLRLVDFEFVNTGDVALDAVSAVFDPAAGGAAEEASAPFGIVLEMPADVTTEDVDHDQDITVDTDGDGGVVAGAAPTAFDHHPVGDVYLPAGPAEKPSGLTGAVIGGMAADTVVTIPDGHGEAVTSDM